MVQLMPLRRVVVEITHEAPPGDSTKVRQAIKSWHNRLSNGSIPRFVITKLGRELYLNLDEWEKWLEERSNHSVPRGQGRPRSQ